MTMPAFADDASSYADSGAGGDPVISIIFFSVVALLSVVTLGVSIGQHAPHGSMQVSSMQHVYSHSPQQVGYLGISQALDKKQEMEDQQALKKGLKVGPQPSKAA